MTMLNNSYMTSKNWTEQKNSSLRVIHTTPLIFSCELKKREFNATEKHHKLLLKITKISVIAKYLYCTLRMVVTLNK